MNSSNDKKLFWACFIALVATAFGFIVRAMIMNDWGTQFNLTETQKGEIFGVGLWPFAISIVLFSLVIDQIGYGRAMLFAFVCHVASAVITICSPLVLAGAGASPGEVTAGQSRGYWMLYVGNLIVALGNGTVEAVINPVVATMFSREKTKWLNILHAGWPGGLVLGGVLAIAMNNDQIAQPLLQAGQGFGLTTLWQWKVALIFIPVLVYAALMIGCEFPVNERVAAGVPYRDMLKEVGFLSALVITTLIVFEVTRVFEEMKLLFTAESWSDKAFAVGGYDVDWKLATRLGVSLGVALLFGLFVLSIGRLMFFFLVIIMIPLAITELGTDSWITPLMEGEMKQFGINPGWVLVYTSLIMTVLRFFAGPIVHALSPLGLLALSAAIAAVGLVSLSMSTGIMILLAATLYGFGKTFFWPTMLGVVSEQFPKGGALTLNMISGIGMLGVGVVGAQLLGNIQDKEVDKELRARNAELHARVVAEPRKSVFGEYRPLDAKRIEAAPADDRQVIEDIQKSAQKNALFTVAIFPCFMLASYLLLIFYFMARGGYKPVEIEAEKFTGGVEGPVR